MTWIELIVLDLTSFTFKLKKYLQVETNDMR